MHRTTRWTLAAALALAACGGGDEPAQEAAPAPAPAPQPAPPPELRLEVDVATRKVTAFRLDQPVGSWGVAVGTAEWPTQSGEWTIKQVVWNPGWTPPPDEEWADDEEPKEPGDPDNPLGRVQMVYDSPRTIHGTNQPESIGQAASHGSIRMRNEEAIALARMVMEAGGAARDAAFFTDVDRNRTQRVEIQLPNPIPIRVINGVANADAVEGESSSSGASTPKASSPAPVTAPAPAERAARPKQTPPSAPPPDTGGHAHHAQHDST